MPAHYAAISITDPNDIDVVWGVGPTPEAALRDAEWNLAEEDEVVTDLVAVPCTEAADFWVRHHGGYGPAELRITTDGVRMRKEKVPPA